MLGYDDYDENDLIMPGMGRAFNRGGPNQVDEYGVPMDLPPDQRRAQRAAAQERLRHKTQIQQ